MTALTRSAPSLAGDPRPAAGTGGVVIACPDCDLVQLLGDEAARGARCGRCGARLVGGGEGQPERALALSVTALLLLLAALGAPLMLMQAQGQARPVTATVLDAMTALAGQQLPALAALVGITAIVLPGFRLGAGVYLLLWLRLGRRPPGLSRVAALLEATRPWAQTEILLLGVVVAMIKLTGVFSVVPGPGLLALVALLTLEKVVGAALPGAGQLWASTPPPPPLSVHLEARR